MPISGFESFFLDKLVEYLRLLDKKFEATPNAIIVTEKVNNKQHEITIVPTEKWIRIIAKLDNINDIPEDKKAEFLRSLLRATWDYPEINFAIDNEGNIVSIQDQYVHAFYLDTFEEEYAAVLASIDIYQKIKEKILGTAKAVKTEAKKDKE